MQRLMLNRLRKNPEKTKQMLIDHVREHLGEDYDVDKHFTPQVYAMGSTFMLCT